MSNLWITAAAERLTYIEPGSGMQDIDTSKHRVQEVSVEHLQPGDLARPAGLPFPFQRINGPSVHDPSHPSDTSEQSDNYDENDPVRMMVPSYRTRYGPHVAEGHPFEVVRGHP